MSIMHKELRANNNTVYHMKDTSDVTIWLFRFSIDFDSIRF